MEFRYPDIVQDELLKDQFIFGLVVKEIQDHLLGEIVAEDTSEKCLLESRRIESKIEQRKLLGIKQLFHMTLYKPIEVEVNLGVEAEAELSHLVFVHNCKYCGKSHSRGNCPAYGKKCQKCGKDNHFKSVCKSGSHTGRDHSKPRGKKGKKKFHEVNESGEGVMDDLAEQVQSVLQ